MFVINVDLKCDMILQLFFYEQTENTQQPQKEEILKSLDQTLCLYVYMQVCVCVCLCKRCKCCAKPWCGLYCGVYIKPH